MRPINPERLWAKALRQEAGGNGVRRRITQATFDGLIMEAERKAERLIGILRIGTALALGVVFNAAVAGTVPEGASDLEMQLLLARLTILAYGALGVLALVLTMKRFHRRAYAFGFVTADAVFVLVSLWSALSNLEIAGSYVTAMPSIWLVPLILAFNALRVSWRAQAYACFVIVVGLWVVGTTGPPYVPNATPPQIGPLFAEPPNVMRSAMLVLAALVLVVAVVRSRGLLYEGLEQARRRASLTHYMPRQVAGLVQERSAAELRRGHRSRVAVLFVDVRAFTARAEALSPEAVSAFLSQYRAILRRAADAHDGILDKFIGDGAMIVFGIPRARPVDAPNALACANAILADVARWSAELAARGEPPVRVGVGLHIGEAFYGAIGDEARVEFTVVGDVVNVAARMEEATKRVDSELVATADFVAAAGAPAEAWRALPDLKVRGKGAPIGAFAWTGL